MFGFHLTRSRRNFSAIYYGIIPSNLLAFEAAARVRAKQGAGSMERRGSRRGLGIRIRLGVRIGFSFFLSLLILILFLILFKRRSRQLVELLVLFLLALLPDIKFGCLICALQTLRELFRI